MHWFKLSIKEKEEMNFLIDSFSDKGSVYVQLSVNIMVTVGPLSDV